MTSGRKLVPRNSPQQYRGHNHCAYTFEAFYGEIDEPIVLEASIQMTAYLICSMKSNPTSDSHQCIIIIKPRREVMPSTRNFPRKLCCSLKGKGVHCVRTLSESTYFGCWLDAYYKQASIFFCPGGGTNSKPVEPLLLLSCRSVSD